MEPVTHVLTGACLARAGLNRRAAYATLTMAIAAELPDTDTLWRLRGPVAAFEHHRGITHTFLGLPFEAAFLVAAIYGLHRWRVSRADVAAAAGAATRSGRTPKPLTAAPVRWGRLYGLALLALLSHLLLDYTNNYGLRPFYPFDSHWYAASIVFIFDPLMFTMLLAGLVAPGIFGLVNSEVGERKRPFRGRAWATAALMGVVALWTLREMEHTRAVNAALAQSIADPAWSTAAPPQMSGTPHRNVNDAEQGGVAPGPDSVLAPAETAVTYLAAQRALANPDPLSPFRWHAVMDFGPVYQLAEIDTRNGTVRAGETLQPKPERSPALLAAEASPLGRFYVNWSPMPFIRVTTADSEAAPGPATAAQGTVVTFSDPRFMGDIPLLHDNGRSPLSAAVTLNARGQVVRQSVGGRTGR